MLNAYDKYGKIYAVNKNTQDAITSGNEQYII